MSNVTYLDPNQFDSEPFNAEEVERQLREGEIVGLLAISVTPKDENSADVRVKLLHDKEREVNPIDCEIFGAPRLLFAFTYLGGLCGCNQNTHRWRVWIGNKCCDTTTPC
jgi:hypothetical protein